MNEVDLRQPNIPMNVSLIPELEQFVQAKVKSGRYLSASEVVREALRLLEERNRIQQMKLESLRKEIMIGVAQLERRTSDLLCFTSPEMNSIRVNNS